MRDQSQSQRHRTRVSALHEQRAYIMRRVFRTVVSYVFRTRTRSALLLRVSHFLFWLLQLERIIIGLYAPPPPPPPPPPPTPLTHTHHTILTKITTTSTPTSCLLYTFCARHSPSLFTCCHT